MRRTLIAVAASLLLALGVGTVAANSAAQRGSAPVPKPAPPPADRAPRPAPAPKPTQAPVRKPHFGIGPRNFGCPGPRVGYMKLFRRLSADPVLVGNVPVKIPEFVFNFATSNSGTAELPASRLVVVVNDHQVATLDAPAGDGGDFSVRFPQVSCGRFQFVEHDPVPDAGSNYGDPDYGYCVVRVKVYMQTPPPPPTPPCPQRTTCAAAAIVGAPVLEMDACVQDEMPKGTAGSIEVHAVRFVGKF